MCNDRALRSATTTVIGTLPSASPADAYRLIEEFDDDARGASALAEAVGAAAERWGIRWAGSRVARLAYAQAAWLLINDHPIGTHLFLQTEYDPAHRLLTITVGDPGGVLPTHPLGEQWRRSLSGPVHADAYHHGGAGRRLRCQVRVRAPWRVRITWDTARMQGTHPRHTYEDCYSPADLRAGLAHVRELGAVLAAHVQGPADRDDVWHEPPDPHSGADVPA